MLTEEYYESKMDVILENYNRAKEYTNTEDWIYNKYKDILFV